MALGRRGGREQALWVAASVLPRSAGHPFYSRRNIRPLAEAEGVPNPTEEEARRWDRRRRGKRVCNKDWASTSDPESRITRMKDGRTHLVYKAEHVIDLDSEVIVAAQIYAGHAADSATLVPSVRKAEAHLERAATVAVVEEVVADKGYHAAAALAACAAWSLRTYIPERQERQPRRWADKAIGWESAFRANRRRTRGGRSHALQRRRSERVERSFAHTCGSGHQRRTWLRGVENVQKRYCLTTAARNPGLL